MKPIEYPEKLTPIFTKPKRIKIMVGGRGGAKSISVASVLAAECAKGKKIACGREFQNSMDDSVHHLIENRIESIDIPGFEIQSNKILHASGGSVIYKGLARNPESIKSIAGIDVFWVEEGQTLSEKSLSLLAPSVRSIESGDKQPEIWITMNRGSSNDPVSQRYLKRAEKDLAKHGYYEDKHLMVVQINYNDNPWFPPELESERQDDDLNLPRAKYRHIWLGDYSDEVENSIILPEWFDACIDAHLKMKWKPTGKKVVSHDPSDLGSDDKGLIMRHGSLLLDAQSISTGDVNEGLDQATGYAIRNNADAFVWDGDGLGLSLRRQVAENLSGKNIEQIMFRGSEGVDHPEAIYEPTNEGAQGRSNKHSFYNKRSQYYWMLRDRFYNTYKAIKDGVYINPDDLISISSEIDCIDLLRSELCRIPEKPNGNGKIQIMRKDQMKTASPNLSDSIMMSFALHGKIANINAVKPRPMRVYGRK